MFEILACAEEPGGSDEAAGVVADVELGEFGGELQRPVESSRRGFGALGGVLGDVRGDGAFGQFLAVVEVGGSDGADVELAAEGEGVGASVDGRAVDTEVDGAALLVLGDLGEGDAGVVAEPAL